MSNEQLESKLIEIISHTPCCGLSSRKAYEHIANHLIENGVMLKPEGGMGEMSDGYHTFNELYHHRAILFSVICNARPDLAWKSKLHDTGDMYDGMFIVGIQTDEGQATYHYDIIPYWDLFKVPELERAPVWDGHTPEMAIWRIAAGLRLENMQATSEENKRWIPVAEQLPKTIPCGAGTAYSEAVNVLTSGRKVLTAIWDGTDFIADAEFWEAENEEITHWTPVLLPLPEVDNG